MSKTDVISGEETVTMICPNLACQRTIAAATSLRGTTVRCAYCNTPFRVPEGDGGSAQHNGDTQKRGQR